MIDLNEAVEELRPIVHREAARRFLRAPADVEFEDLTQEGFIGLIRTARRYDGREDTKFSTYARHRVRGQMEDYLRTLGEIALRRPHEFTTDHREEEDRDIWETIGRYDDGLQYVIRWPHDVRSALHREFYELSSRDRDLLCLIYADELPITWAGRELGLSDGYAVERHRVLILRLRARLREFVV